jgi:hypothetical protein
MESNNKYRQNYMIELNDSIERHSKIRKNPALFILSKNLKEYVMKKITTDDLPNEAYYGTVYLIKGKTIFQFTSTPKYENQDIRFSANTWVTPSWYNDPWIYKSVVNVHNMFIGDINEFSNVNQFLDMDEMTSNDLDRTQKFMMALLKNKFKIYVADVSKVDI